jgi:hypothetical protein
MQIDMMTAYYFRERRAGWILQDVVTDDPGSKPDKRYARRRDRQITFGKLSIYLGVTISYNKCFQQMRLVLYLYFIYLLSPYMFRAFLGPSSGVS